MADPLTLGQAAARHGAYRWVEHRLFELTGVWAADPALPPALQVHLFEASAQHAAHAAAWLARLPVLATVDRDELTRPIGPVLEALVASLASNDGAGAPGGGSPGAPGEGSPGAPSSRSACRLRCVAGLYRVALPRLLDSYRQHSARLSPVSDEPSRQTVAAVVQAEEAEVAVARTLLAQADEATAVVMAEGAAHVEQALQEAAGGLDEGLDLPGDGLIPWSDSRCAW